jgi:hypothetical protein
MKLSLSSHSAMARVSVTCSISEGYAKRRNRERVALLRQPFPRSKEMGQLGIQIQSVVYFPGAALRKYASRLSRHLSPISL